MNKISPAFYFCCNHEGFGARFRLVACLALLCMEYRCEREDRDLPPTYFCKLFP